MTALADTVYVNASKLNYRSQPSTASGKVLGTLSRGTEVSRVKNNGEWSEIQVGGSKTTVYVASRYLTASKPQAWETAQRVRQPEVRLQSPQMEPLRSLIP